MVPSDQLASRRSLNACPWEPDLSCKICARRRQVLIHPTWHGRACRHSPVITCFEKENVMERIEKVLYTAKAHTTGGRDGGSRTSDGRLDVKLSVPGSHGSGTNPEQLFAVG